jgi:hypothetical protein
VLTDSASILAALLVYDQYPLTAPDLFAAKQLNLGRTASPQLHAGGQRQL